MFPALEPKDRVQEIPDDLGVTPKKEGRGADGEVSNKALIVVEVRALVIVGRPHADSPTVELHDRLPKAPPRTSFQTGRHEL